MIAITKTLFAALHVFCAKWINLPSVAIPSVRSGSPLWQLAAVSTALLLGGGQTSDAANSELTNPPSVNPSVTYAFDVTASDSGMATSDPSGVAW